MRVKTEAPLRIGVWQGSVSPQINENLSSVYASIDRAATAGCDFLCLPECFLTGLGSSTILQSSAMAVTDSRLRDLSCAAHDMVLLVGLAERCGARLFNTQAVLQNGQLLGAYRKTVLTEADVQVCGFSPDYGLPVFEAHGVKFGIQICHDSGFPEIAGALVAQGARLLFSPQFTLSAPGQVNQHRLRARNVHAGLAALFGLVVVRANVVSTHDPYERVGYGDSAIFSPLGTPLAEAGLFTTALAHADVAPWLLNDWTARRSELSERLLLVATDHMRRAAARRPDERQD